MLAKQQIQRSFNHFNPRNYLKDYYSYVEPDEIKTIAFEIEIFRVIHRLFGQVKILEYGSGPTHHHTIPLSPYVGEIDIAEYNPSNLIEVIEWVWNKPGTHPWSWVPFTRYALQCEGVVEPTGLQIIAREQMTRNKIRRFIQSDADFIDPRSNVFRAPYPVVTSWYCADSSTDDKEIWRSRMRNIVSLVASGGIFVTAALRKAAAYKVGNMYFPSANIDENDMTDVLTLDFDPQSIIVEVKDVPEHRVLGYEGIILAHARKQT